MKKSKKIIIIIPIMIVAGLVVTSLIYFWSTMSALDCKNYCIEHTARNATKFTRIGDGRYVDDYAYWIAANGDSKRAQEIFIFTRKSLGMFHFDRYEFVADSARNTQTEGAEKAGSIQFFTRKDNGEKETGSTLLFFGARADSDIVRYEYTLTVAEGSNVYNGNVVFGDGVWFVKFFDIGNADEHRKKLVSNVKFFDSDNKLIYTYN